MAARLVDLVVGGAVGAIAASQGVALPGALVVTAGVDASAAAARAVRPDWFPGTESITLGDVLVMGLGAVAGWGVARALLPGSEGDTATSGAALVLASLAVAGVAVLPLAEVRSPGRLRRANPAGRTR